METHDYKSLKFYNISVEEWKHIKQDAVEQDIPLYEFFLRIYRVWRQAKLSHEQGGENATS